MRLHWSSRGISLTCNPVIGAATPKGKPALETFAYKLEEVLRIIGLLPEPAATVAATAAFIGLRRSEIRGLLWENYDGKEIRVTRSVWGKHVDDPKTTKSKAPVPVIEVLRGMLDAHRARCGNPASGPIFANSLGKPLCLNNLFNRVIAPALEQCSCSKRRGEHVGEDHAFKLDASAPKLWQGWHAFRRGLATNLYRLRVPDKTIQAILRHANLQTTLNVYVKSVEEDSVKAMNALEVLMCAKRAPEQPEQVAALPN